MGKGLCLTQVCLTWFDCTKRNILQYHRLLFAKFLDSENLFFNQDILYFNRTKQNSNIHSSLRIQECGRFEFDTRYGNDWVYQNLCLIVQDR